MKIEQYIQKLILEQDSSGWYIKIFASDTAQGQKADDAAKDAGAVRGFFVKAKNFYKANPVNDIAIQQDIIDIIKTQPAVLGPGGVYDDVKYMYVILPLKTLNPKKIKKFYGFIIDRQKVNEFIRVLDAKLKTNAYFKTQPNVSNDLTQLSNIKVYNAAQYQNLITQLSKITSRLNDPVVNSLFNKLKKSLPDTTKFFNLTFDETGEKEIVEIDTDDFKGTAYQITVPETGETILFPIQGIQAVQQLYGRPGRGIFSGKFNNKGLPESGEVWYSNINLNGKTSPWPDYEYVTSDANGGGFIYFNGTLWPTPAGDPLDPGFNFRFKEGEFHFDDGEKYIGTLFEKTQRANNGTLYNKDGTTKAIAKNGEITLTPEEINRRSKAKADAEAKAKADAEAKKKKDAETTKKKEKERVEKIKNKTFKYPFTDSRVKQLGITQKQVYEKDGFVYFISNENNGEIRTTTKKDFEETYKDLSKNKITQLQKKEVPADIRNSLKMSLTWKNPSAKITLYKRDVNMFKPQSITPLGKELTNVIAKEVFEKDPNKFYKIDFKYKDKEYKGQYWIKSTEVKETVSF